MATRAIWKGSLKVGLVTVPARMFSATAKQTKITFHHLHGECKQRVQHKKWCATCATELQSTDVVRGFEYAKGQHVIITDDELDAQADEATHTLEVTTIATDRIDPVYIDTTAYLVPEGPAGESAFETLRVALEDRVAVGSVVLHDRNTKVALAALPKGFLVYVLRAHEQVRPIEEVQSAAAALPLPPKADIALARKLLSAMEGELNYEDVKDEYAVRLRQLIEDKVTGRVRTPEHAAPRPKIVSLADALQQSLSLVEKLPTKAAKPAKAEVITHQPRRAASR